MLIYELSLEFVIFYYENFKAGCWIEKTFCEKNVRFIEVGGMGLGCTFQFKSQCIKNEKHQSSSNTNAI